MKKKKKKTIISFVALITLIALPNNIGAVTLKEYEDNVAKYTKELKEKESKIAKNKEEVAQVKKNISNIENQIKDVENNIERLQKEIEESNKKIAKKKEESKKIMKYFQVINGENSYLEYVFGATSMTDMIYRMSVVEQLAEYNQKIVKELNELIEQNKKKKEDLSKKQTELATLKKKLESEKERIEGEIKAIEGTVPSTKGSIQFYQSRVNYYKSKGCKTNDIIGVTCDVPKKVTPGGDGGSNSSGPGAIIGKNGFRFPINGGYISQSYGNNGHRGVDIGHRNRCGTPIYAVAAGKVYYVGSGLDLYGAKMVMIVHNVNGRLVFSQYAHLQGYNVSTGQEVDNNTIIGYMGNSGYSFGCHLHLEMSRNYGWGYNGTYNQYLNSIIDPFTYVPSP